MKLYSALASGHCHRVELLLSILKLDYEVIIIDLAARGQRTPEFLKLNPWGQVPVLLDGDLVLHESNAIMVYIAKKAGALGWLPEEPGPSAGVQTWLSASSGALAFGCSRARTIARFGSPGDLADAQLVGKRLLEKIEKVIEDSGFLAGRSPTIADLAMYSYVASASEAGIGEFVGKRTAAWLDRVEGLPGFIPMRE